MLGLPSFPMEKSAASTEPQGPRPVLGRESVQVPDDQDFRSFRSECEAEVGWNLTYSKAGVSVWVQAMEMDRTLHKIKVGVHYCTCSLHHTLLPHPRVSCACCRATDPWGCILAHKESPARNQEEAWSTEPSLRYTDGPTEA